MVEADSHVVREQCNEENPKGPASCALEVTTIDYCQLEILWRVNTVSSFVLISILRGQPRTPPSGDNLGILDYHLNTHLSLIYPLKDPKQSVQTSKVIYSEHNQKVNQC